MTTLLNLPAEVQVLIASNLPFPDLLALKLSHPYFYRIIHPTVYDRVNWLLDRPRLGLPIPSQTKCVMKNDVVFVANKEVKEMLKRRRLHLECVDVGKDGTCLVLEGWKCPKAGTSAMRKRLLRKQMYVFWEVLKNYLAVLFTIDIDPRIGALLWHYALGIVLAALAVVVAIWRTTTASPESAVP